MIAAPQCDVVANRYEWLDSVVFKQEDIFTDPPIVQDGSVGAHIAGEFVAESLSGKIFFLPHTVQFGVGQRHEHRVGLRRKALCDLVEGH
ncbi:Uncharacterised protein [Mycobacterium tuberculosis]|nr:Uncharacterised protein [Mycobacterium tuberculosis]CNZ06137.1 Uncharacterised protein [Mycobacterium tuberculosis]SGF31106.1 Uncharacterised protein [Mycobacterium tuberculosis]